MVTHSMDDARVSLPYQDGYLAITNTHLVVMHRQRVAEYLAFVHLHDAHAEQAHAFRHRVLGIVCAAILLVPSLVALVAGVNNPAALKSKLGFAALFGTFFGLMFLWGVCRSQRIWWVHVRYGDAGKNIPLPGVDERELARFVEALMIAARTTHAT